MPVDPSKRPYAFPASLPPGGPDLASVVELLSIIASNFEPRGIFSAGHATLSKNKPILIKGFTPGRRSFVLQNLGVGGNFATGLLYINSTNIVSINNGALVLPSGSVRILNNVSEVWGYSDSDNLIISWVED
jgi:hypothetical protein